ncbi:MAG: hypothetical protein IPP29_16660 [Bacteroidetes bacterium]|nr:hypothetical protein [Bacteroidota bacterium]
MIEKNIDGLDIYWFVTMDKTNNDLPGYVEGLLMQVILTFTVICHHGIRILNEGSILESPNGQIK